MAHARFQHLHLDDRRSSTGSRQPGRRLARSPPGLAGAAHRSTANCAATTSETGMPPAIAGAIFPATIRSPRSSWLKIGGSAWPSWLGTTSCAPTLLTACAQAGRRSKSPAGCGWIGRPEMRRAGSATRRSTATSTVKPADPMTCVNACLGRASAAARGTDAARVATAFQPTGALDAGLPRSRPAPAWAIGKLT